ncbi:MAG: hypothetical protein RR619_10220 [Raoultibacter sp.]
MALLKTMELASGLTLNYHRVVSLNVITNVQNTVEIASYPSRAKRDEEIAALAAGELHNVYIETQFVAKNYKSTETIRDVYNENAEDV